MATRTVFYSWQSDLPNSTNRGLIEKALEEAAKAIRSDDTVQIDPVVDRDTAGVPGSPDIARTIFEKIERAAAFVCDVSVINSGDRGRPTPNPNVLIELGYALKHLGIGRIIMVMNTSFGGPELLPFDLKTKRVVAYDMPHDVSEKAPGRNKLQRVLEEGLRAILAGVGSQQEGTASPALQAQVAVEAREPDQAVLVGRYMRSLSEEIASLAPDLSHGNENVDDSLVEALAKTEGLVADFAHLAASISAMNAKEAAESVHDGFGSILERYGLPLGFNGSWRECQFDFDKFLGHELFVIFTSRLMRAGRWELLADLLEKGIYVANADRQYGQGSLVPFTYGSQYVRLLEHRSRRLKLERVSVHADLLNDRHTKGVLGEAMPMKDFIESDCFLYLRATLSRPEADQHSLGWIPWSSIYMRGTPRFLVEATSRQNAQRLVRPLGLDSIESFRIRFRERAYRLADLYRHKTFKFDPFYGFNPDDIGSDKMAYTT